MPEIANQSVFLVDAYSEPILVRVTGRASFQNSAALKEFFQVMIKQGRTCFVVDFLHCTSMDSTFLGVLAGVAMQLGKLNPPGNLTLCRLGVRNLELVRNLGLHRLLTVDANRAELNFGHTAQPLPSPATSDHIAHARLVLEAHENLVAADRSNQSRFQDLVAFLRNRIESK